MTGDGQVQVNLLLGTSRAALNKAVELMGRMLRVSGKGPKIIELLTARSSIERTPLRGLRPLLTAQSAKNMRSVFNQSNN